MRWVALVVVAAIGCSRGELVGDEHPSGAPREATVVGETNGPANAIAVDGAFVYVGTGACIADPSNPGTAKATGDVVSLPIDGGDAREVWNGPEMISAISTWEGDLFVMSEGQCMVGHSINFRRIRISSGGSDRIGYFGGGLSCAKLLPAADAIFWLVPGAVHRYDGRNDTTIASGYTCNGDMALGAGGVVWAASSSLFGVPTTGGATSELWRGTDNLYSMAGDPLQRGFYVATQTTILFVKADDGRAQELAGGQDTIGSVIADDRYVYWSEPASGRILERAWPDGLPIVVASSVRPGPMAQTAGDLFWAEYDRTRQVSSIKRIAKTGP